MERKELEERLDQQIPRWREYAGSVEHTSYPWGCGVCGLVELRTIHEHTENKCPITKCEGHWS